MSTALVERSYARTVRVLAPLFGLYGELDSVERLVRFLNQVDSCIPGPDDGYAVCRGSISIGPLSYQLEGTLLVERVVPPHSLRVVLRAPGLRLEVEGMFDFEVTAAEETTLRYAATIRSSHPLVRRMRRSLTGVLEEHVDSATDLIMVRARQYVEAERRFTELREGGEE